MQPSQKRKTIFTLLLAGLVVLLLVMQSGLLWIFGGVLPMDGEVLFVGPGTERGKVAAVKLSLGPTVNALIPAACLVFPGQVATVRFTGPIIGATPSFTLWESRDKQ